MILVLDTCGAVGGVALADIASADPRIVGEVAITGKTFAAELVPAISSLLQRRQSHGRRTGRSRRRSRPRQFYRRAHRCQRRQGPGRSGRHSSHRPFAARSAHAQSRRFLVSPSPSSMPVVANSMSESTRQGIACWSLS